MALAILMHLAVSTCSAMILGLAWGKLNYGIALVSLLIGAVAGIWGWQSSKDEKRLFPEVKFVQALFYGFILFAALQHFLYLLYYDRNSINTLHAYNFGDLSMHLQYIRYIAHGAHFWPDNPEFAGDLLRYPIGMDLYNALWENIGVPADSHLFLAGIIMTVVTISLLHKWMGWLGVGAFFLNGGLANWQSILEKRLYDFQDTVAWKNFFLSLWITQRGFLFAIPAGIYVIKMVTETDYCGIISGSKAEKVDSCKFKIFYGVVGTAPMIKQCPVNLECTVAHTLDLGSHVLIIGKIEETYINDNCLTDGKPDITKIKPFMYTSYEESYRQIGDVLAKAFHVGKSLKGKEA